MHTTKADNCESRKEPQACYSINSLDPYSNSLRYVCPYPHSVDEKLGTEGKQWDQSHSQKAYSWDLNSGNLDPEWKYLTKCNSASYAEMLLCSPNIPSSY